jgi:hypothetical protein
VIKAHAPGKALSDSSIPFKVGCTPTPKNISVMGDRGEYRPIRHGDTFIEGEFEGLKNRLLGQPDILAYGPTPTGVYPEYAFPYTNNIDLCVYKEGVKDGCITYNTILGKNFLEDFLFLSFKFCFDLLVQARRISICYQDLSSLLYCEQFKYSDLRSDGSLLAKAPTEGSYILRLYKNGMRMAMGSTYDFTVSPAPVTLGATIGPPTVNPIYITFNPSMTFDPQDTYYGEYIIITDGAETFYHQDVFEGTAYPTAWFDVQGGYKLQIYRNGLRLKNGTDYSVVFEPNLGVAHIRLIDDVSADYPLDSNDILIIDYITTDLEYGALPLDNDKVTPIVEGQNTYPSFVDNIFTSRLECDISEWNLPNYMAIYKNGIRQLPILAADIDTVGNDFIFSPNSTESLIVANFTNPFTVMDTGTGFGTNDNFVVELVYTKVSSTRLMDFLNASQQFIDNKLAIKMVPDPNSGKDLAVLESPYTLEFPEDDTSHAALFGDSPTLYPGKDEKGNFKFYIDFWNNKWRYTFDSPLKKMQHISAATFPR